VDAVDISDEQFPPTAFRPRNTRFWTHDSYKAFPKEYLGQFDIVNVRFMLYQINDDVVDRLITNVLTLLSQSTEPPHSVMTEHSSDTRQNLGATCSGLNHFLTRPDLGAAVTSLHRLAKNASPYGKSLLLTVRTSAYITVLY
jgi:hypothetical protein